MVRLLRPPHLTWSSRCLLPRVGFLVHDVVTFGLVTQRVHSSHGLQASLSLWLAIFYFTVTGVFVWFDHVNGPQPEHQTPVPDEVRPPTHITP